MAKSAFSPFTNCAVKIQTAASGYEIINGNPVPKTESVELRAMVTQKDPPPNVTINRSPGVVTTVPSLEGYFVEELPENSSFPQVVTITYDTGGTASYRLLLKVPSPYYDEVGLLGHPFYLEPWDE